MIFFEKKVQRQITIRKGLNSPKKPKQFLLLLFVNNINNVPKVTGTIILTKGLAQNTKKIPKSYYLNGKSCRLGFVPALQLRSCPKVLKRFL